MALVGVRRIRTVFGDKPKEGGQTTRIKVPQPVERPYSVRSRDVIKRELLRAPREGFVVHKRGIQRDFVGQDYREVRAISHDKLRGTLPERIVYLWLITKMHMKDGVDFDFQCLERHHKVLTSDLRWVEVGSLKPGDTLLSFDEEGEGRINRRAWKLGTVLQNEIDTAEVMEVSLSNGMKIYATPEHPWLVRHSIGANGWSKDWGKEASIGWVRTDNLKVGTYVPLYMDTWEQDTSYKAGWLSGFFDGEGSVVHSKTQTGGHSMSVTIGQNAGGMFDRFIQYVDDLGFDFAVYDYRDKHKRSYDDGKRQVISCRIAGGRSEAMRFLGTIRPMKLFNMKIHKLGRMTKKSQVRVTDIKPAGKREIARLSVDTHTYIAEGIGMHNSSLSGGRIEMGGIVADFRFLIYKFILNVQGPTHTEFLRMRKDEEQRAILEDMGYRVEELTDLEIYNEEIFENKMRRMFNLAGGSGGGYSQEHVIDTDPGNDPVLIGDVLADVIYLNNQVEAIFG